MVLARSSEDGEWGVVFNGHKVSDLQDGKDWLYNSVNELNTTELYTLKQLRW